MDVQLAAGVGRMVEPINGKIYRTSHDESMLVVGVKAGKILVEFADGRLMRLSDREWQQLNPNPSRC
jgi:hypothetical protein